MKTKYVLWTWDDEVYEVLKVNGSKYTIKNIKSGDIAKAHENEVIVINNM